MMPSAYLSALSEMSRKDIFAELVKVYDQYVRVRSDRGRLLEALENLLAADPGGYIWEYGIRTDARQEAQETLDSLEVPDE